MKASELREKNNEEIELYIRERTDDLMHFRIQQATGVVENIRAARELRREVARAKTILNERKRAEQKQ